MHHFPQGGPRRVGVGKWSSTNSHSVEISKVLLLLLIGLVAVWYDLLQTAISQIPTCFLNYHRASACS